jgi:predicted phage-related endonuclease
MPIVITETLRRHMIELLREIPMPIYSPEANAIEHRSIDETTAGEREQWLLDQGRSIGGSSVGAIIGANSHASATDVYDGLWAPSTRERPNAASRRRMDRGHMMEPIIAQLYEIETGRLLEGDGRTRTQHPRLHYIHATPDRIIIDPLGSTMGDSAEMQQGEATGAYGNGVWECKCLGINTFTETLAMGVDPSYYAQLQLYLSVFGLTWGSFAIFNAEEWRLYWFDVLRNDRFILRMERRVEHFWREHVLARRRPETTDQIVTAEALMPPPHTGAEVRVMDADEQAVRLFGQLRVAHANRKVAEDAYKRLVEEAKTFMTERCESKARVGGVGKINWIATTRETLDKDALALAHPEIDLAQYTQCSESSTFTFTPETRR